MARPCRGYWWRESAAHGHARDIENSGQKLRRCYTCHMDLNIRNVDPDLVKALKAFALSRDLTLRDFCLSSLRTAVIIHEEPKNGCVKCGSPGHDESGCMNGDRTYKGLRDVEQEAWRKLHRNASPF